MKILLAANPSSTHTYRWINALHERGIELAVFSFTDFDKNLYKHLSNINFYSIGKKSSLNKNENKFKKINYIFDIYKLRKILSVEKPDILHAHYASSYGFISALSGFKPLIVSVWGSDIYSFPRSSYVTNKIIKYTFSKADRIFSTSKDMAREASLYTDKKIDVTPFGIDTSQFINNGKRLFFSPDDIVIGTVKNLEPVSGIDILLKSFALLKKKYESLPLKMIIAGDGSERKNLENMAQDLSISEDIIFTGFIDHSMINDYFSSMDIYAAPSRAESFGVAVLEASACGLPVIAANVGGLPEVVDEGKSGFLANPDNVNDFTDALEKLVVNRDFAAKMGIYGREFVKNNYNWDKNVDDVISFYKETALAHTH